MSRRALKLAVRDTLKAALAVDYRYVGVVPSGRPPAGCGKWFLGVHHGGTTTSRVDTGLDQTHRVVVTATWRVNEPLDRVGDVTIDKAADGLDDVCDKVIYALQTDQQHDATIDVANGYLSAAEQTIGIFFEALEFAGDGEDVLVGPEWFSGKPEVPGEFCGVVRALNFGGARRLRQLG